MRQILNSIQYGVHFFPLIFERFNLSLFYFPFFSLPVPAKLIDRSQS